MEDKTQTKTKRPEELGVDAYKLGCELGNFEDWLNKLPEDQRSKRGMPQMLMDSYKKGVEHWTDKYNPVDRLCIFIEDPTGTCFSRCAECLPDVFVANNKKAMAGIQSHHMSVLVNEAFVGKHVLGLSDIEVRDVNKNYRWTGVLMVVVVPYGFERWLKKCGVKFAMKQKLKPAQQEALDNYRKRFCICKYENETLTLISGSQPVYIESLEGHNQMFTGIQNHINGVVSEDGFECCGEEYSEECADAYKNAVIADDFGAEE